MVKAKLIIGLYALVFIFIVPASGFGNDDKGYLRLNAGLFLPNDFQNASTKKGLATELVAGYLFAPFFGLEVQTGYYETEIVPSSSLQTRNLHIIPLTLTAKSINRFENGEFAIGIGFGIYYENLEGNFGTFTLNDTDSVFGYHIDFGFMFDIARNVHIGLEWKILSLDEATFSDQGVNVWFEMNGQVLVGTLGCRF